MVWQDRPLVWGLFLFARLSLRIFYCQFLDIFVSLGLEGIGAGGRSYRIFILCSIFRDYEEIKQNWGQGRRPRENAEERCSC